MQSFERLPAELPVHVTVNALLPGGELPLEFSSAEDLALFFAALRSDQLVGMMLPQQDGAEAGLYPIGCAGRIRQYRERKDGKLNIMLTGLCRFRMVEDISAARDYRAARVDWQDFRQDYAVATLDDATVDGFKATLRSYFERHNMQVDWPVLDKLPIEQVVNNLALLINLTLAGKQALLDAPTVADRLALFARLLDEKADPILAPAPPGKRVN